MMAGAADTVQELPALDLHQGVPKPDLPPQEVTHPQHRERGVRQFEGSQHVTR
jgi:hypothetical protein